MNSTRSSSNSNATSNTNTNDSISNDNLIIKDEHVILNKFDDDVYLNNIQVTPRINTNNNISNNNFDFYRSDSPVSLSINGSASGSANGSANGSAIGSANGSDYGHYNNGDIESNIHNSKSLSEDINSLSLTDIANITHQNLHKVVNKRKHKYNYKELKIKDIERNIDKYYTQENYKYTNEIDILTTYAKGLKNIYIQSQRISQLKLNCLMIPAFILSCGITILTPFTDCENNQSKLLSVGNAIIALIITIVNYLKLETRAQNFLQLFFHYDKLETILQLTTNKLIVMDNEHDKKKLVLSKINEVEQKIYEIKDNYNVIIPNEIASLFPIASQMNIFSFIKKIHTTHNSLIHNLCDIKNEMRYIEHKWKQETQKDMNNSIYFNNHNNEVERMKYLFSIKEQIKTDINEYRNVYGHLDEIFSREIKHASIILNNYGLFYICCWNRANNKHDYRGVDNIIDKYYHFLFDDY